MDFDADGNSRCRPRTPCRAPAWRGTTALRSGHERTASTGAPFREPLPDTWFEGAPRALRGRAGRLPHRHCWSPFPELPAKLPRCAAAQARPGGVPGPPGQGMRAKPSRLDSPAPSARSAPRSRPTRSSRWASVTRSAVDRLFRGRRRRPCHLGRRPVDAPGRADGGGRSIYRLHLFEVAQSVMHTAGQSFNMAYAGSGVNALDPRHRGPGLCRSGDGRGGAHGALGAPVRALADHCWTRPPAGPARRRRVFLLRQLPDRNAWPSMMASRHRQPGDRQAAPGHDPADGHQRARVPPGAGRRLRPEPGDDGHRQRRGAAGQVLVKHPKTAIVDFTGSARFGQWVEQGAHPALCASPRPRAATPWCWSPPTT